MKTTLLFISMALLSCSMLSGQTTNASVYGFAPGNTGTANTQALIDAMDAHRSGNLDVLQINAGVFQVSDSVNIAGWDGLQIIGSGDDTTIWTDKNTSIFIARHSDDPVSGGLIKNLKLESKYIGTNGLKRDDDNPGLFFLGNMTFSNFVFENVEFTAPNAHINGIFVSNSYGSSRVTQGISIINCRFHNLGRMGMEFFNEPNPNILDLTSRFENISVTGSSFKDLGRLVDHTGADHGIGISFGGIGKNHNVSGNTFGADIRTMNIEVAGVDTISISNNLHLGSGGSMYQFNAPTSKNITITNDQAFDNYSIHNYVHYVENLVIENSTLYGGLLIGQYDGVTEVSDIWVRNSTIINNESLADAYGAIAFHGVNSTINNINFENCYIGEFSTRIPQRPVVYTTGDKITNVNFKDTCLFFLGEGELKQGDPAPINFVNITSDCEDVFFPPTAIDEIVSVDAPKDVVRGNPVTVSVEYSAKEARDISVALKLGSPYASYRGTVSVGAGSGNAEVQIPIPADAVLGNETYRYQVLLLPPGQLAYSMRKAEAYLGKVSVTDGAPPTDPDGDIVSVSAPKDVVRGTPVTVWVEYTANTAIDVSVALKLGSPYASYRSIVPVSAGSGNIPVQVTVPPNAVLGFETYRYQILLLPPGQSAYSAHLDQAYVGKVSVTENQGTNLQASLDFQSVANSKEVETLSVYPNPAINKIIVQIPFEESYGSYALYAINGAVVKEGSIDSNQKELPITFSDIAKGLYVLRLSNSKGEEAFKKIVKE